MSQATPNGGHGPPYLSPDFISVAKPNGAIHRTLLNYIGLSLKAALAGFQVYISFNIK